MANELREITNQINKGAKIAKDNWNAETPKNVRIAQWLSGVAGVLSIVVSGVQELNKSAIQLNSSIQNIVNITSIAGPVVALLLQFVAKRIK